MLPKHHSKLPVSLPHPFLQLQTPVSFFFFHLIVANAFFSLFLQAALDLSWGKKRNIKK